ncbi:16S rRNA (uracil(1498)-N(3))-methyltransferase [Candidatus Clostridium radicumherbarum]|uniref:Ribosomal RNA small subunit methyltransferase E n=1 Tax=Candidatus Clostridium radicumherbarum TaxID=3381662 RepID=A0ABW8TQ34_9CLOT
MNKFFVQKQSISNNRAIIEGEDVKHIYKVLRLNTLDKISINDCEGTEYLGEISEITKSRVEVRLLDKLQINNESPLNVYLFQGLPKSSKMDLIVQKNTELGIKEITPVITERVVVKNELGEFRKVDRWNRIALEASKQSKRSLIPKINTPIEFKDLLMELKLMDLILVPYENEENIGLKNINFKDRKNIKNAAIIIGPEGGFENSEIESLKNLGAHIITLGPRILRTETAGFVCVSQVMYELSDMGGNEGDLI